GIVVVRVEPGKNVSLGRGKALVDGVNLPAVGFAPVSNVGMPFRVSVDQFPATVRGKRIEDDVFVVRPPLAANAFQRPGDVLRLIERRCDYRDLHPGPLLVRTHSTGNAIGIANHSYRFRNSNPDQVLDAGTILRGVTLCSPKSENAFFIPDSLK